MRFSCLALAALMATSVVPAHAGYTTFDYTGIVSRIFAAGDGPASVADITLGSTVTFSVTFDPSKFVAFPTLRTTDASGDRLALHPVTATLFDDPGASYTISTTRLDANMNLVPTHTWTLAGDDYDGYVSPNGIGPFPEVSHDGRPSLPIGLEADSINAEGLEFYSAPADFLLGYLRHPAYIYDQNSDYAVAIDTSLDPNILAIRTEALAEGQVPEPSTGVMLMLGGLAMHAIVRRRIVRHRGSAWLPA